jgi:hypothetical protein
MVGSRQKAVTAFLAVCDDTMMDRWIPDEDWVRQIRDNDKVDCSIVNLNTGLSAQCMWQSNHATLQGRTIYFNKKNVRISKSNKAVSFYYVLSSSSKPTPTVPSNQGFYQSLWDHSDRSNRSLKRTAPLAKKVSTPQAKKSKTSAVARAVSPQPNPLLPLPLSPPKSFEEASRREGERRARRG